MLIPDWVEFRYKGERLSRLGGRHLISKEEQMSGGFHAQAWKNYMLRTANLIEAASKVNPKRRMGCSTTSRYRNDRAPQINKIEIIRYINPVYKVSWN